MTTELKLSESDDARLMQAATTGPALGNSEQDIRILAALKATQQVSPSVGEKIGIRDGYLGFGGDSQPPGNWAPYGALWKQDATTSEHPRSATLVANTLNKFGTFGFISVGVIPWGDWSHTVYWAQPTDPQVELRITNSHGNLAASQLIRLPKGAQPANSSDGHLLDVHPDGFCEELWSCQQINWSLTKPVLTAINGNRTRIDGTGWEGNATASHANLLAGIIRYEELAAGTINHPLFCVIPRGSELTDFGYGCQPASGSDGSYVHPAVHGDAKTSGSNLLPMGALMRLNYSDSEIAAKNWPAYRKTIIKAASRKGFYFCDTGGNTPGFQFMSGTSYTSLGLPNPFIALAKKEGLYDNGGYYSFDIHTGVEWAQRLRVCIPFS